MNTKEKFLGSILGLAIGDALGYPCEFRSRAAILRGFGPDGVQDMVSLQDERWAGRPVIIGRTQPAGTFSDDTQMTIALAEGMLDVGIDAPVEELMVAIGHRFVTWSHSPDNDRAPGNTCMTGVSNFERGADWRVSGVAQSKGCGSAMRVAPIGLVYYDDHQRLLEVARASSLITHGHDAAIEGAAAAALLVALALEGATGEEMYEEVMSACAERSHDFRACMEKLPAMLHEPPEIALSSAGLGEAWVAEEAVASALYCVMRYPDDVDAALLCGANTDGDSDSIAAIAGSMIGARLGANAIRAAWRTQIEDSEYLQSLAERLWAART